jgi:hypothetical protein
MINAAPITSATTANVRCMIKNDTLSNNAPRKKNNNVYHKFFLAGFDLVSMLYRDR